MAYSTDMNLAAALDDQSIKLQNFSLKLNGQDILIQQNLNLERDQIVSLVGLSGSGKSQTLKALSQADRAVYLSQENELPGWLTVEQNLKLVSADRALMNSWLSRLDLSAAIHKYPHQLSVGMRHRVCLIRAFLTKRKFLLLDEPFVSLDIINRQKLYEAVLLYKKESGCAVLLATHHLDEALNFSNKVLFQSLKLKRITYEWDVGQTESTTTLRLMHEAFQQDVIREA